MKKLKIKFNSNTVFDGFNLIIMILLILLMIYPFWYLLMYSLSAPGTTGSGGFYLWPKNFTLESFQTVLKNRSILTGFKTSIIVTFFGSLIGTMMTALLAYPLSKPNLRGVKFFNVMVLFTMLFSGGMVPMFLLIKNLKLIDTYWALILPGVLHAWNVFVMRNFFQGIPSSVEESAKMDGASDIRILFSIVLPMSKPVLATIALFLAVGYWNDFFSTIVYINSKDKWALQAVLREVITSTSEFMKNQGVTIQSSGNITSTSIRMATIIISTVPILIIYPFAQKYFVKGANIGSVKG